MGTDDRVPPAAGEQADPIEVLQATPLRLAAIVETSSADWLESPYGPGKWRRREVIAHLADVELAFSYRMRQAVGEPGSAFTPFDQDAWARRNTRIDATVALEAFRAMRALNLAWLASLDLQGWLAGGHHPVHGPQSVDDLVRYLAGHDLNHLEQLERP
jgi:hypothetical protein